MDNLGFKELYDVSLKATYSMELDGRTIESGETIAAFDRIQMANFNETRLTSTAHGGYGNRTLILWENTQDVKISFIQGVFSKTHLALMTNAKLIKIGSEQPILINKRECIETDEEGIAYTKYEVHSGLYVYDYETGERLPGIRAYQNAVHIGKAFRQYVVEYIFEYQDGASILKVGNPLTSGFLSLTGKMKVKDDTTGKVVTGIIKIPKLRLMSDLSIRVGSDAIPQVGRLDAVAVPEGVRGQQKVMEIIFLNDDIDADM